MLHMNMGCVLSELMLDTKCLMFEHLIHTNMRCVLSELMLYTKMCYVRTYVTLEFCRNSLEDEFYSVIECPLYQDLRQEYIKRYFWAKPNMP